MKFYSGDFWMFKFDIKMVLVSEGVWLYIVLIKGVVLNISFIYNM